MFERSYSKILFSTLCITHHAYAKKKIKISHSHIHLLCILILTLFILTHCEKQHEIFAACIINVWSFTDVLPKIKTTTTKKESSSKDHKLIFNQTLPTSNWKSSMTFKLYLFYLNIPGICTSEVSSFALFRFLDVLKGCREKNLSLGLPHCLTIKYFIKYAYH